MAELRILDVESGEELGPGEVGEIYMLPPGYPVFLALGLWAGGERLAFPLLIQILISLLTAALLYDTGRKIKNATLGMIVVVFYLLNPNAAFWSNVVLSETLTAFWITLSVWGMVHYWTTPGRGWLFLSGLSLGLSALTRPMALGLISTMQPETILA